MVRVSLLEYYLQHMFLARRHAVGLGPLRPRQLAPSAPSWPPSGVAMCSVPCVKVRFPPAFPSSCHDSELLGEYCFAPGHDGLPSVETKQHTHHLSCGCDESTT